MIPLRTRFPKLLATVLGFATAACTLAAVADAAVVYTPDADISVPDDANGVYLDVTTGQYDSDFTQVPNYDIHLYLNAAIGAGASLRFSANTGGGYVGAVFNNPLNLDPGYEIGPTLANGYGYYSGNNSLTAAFHQDGTEILGFEFLDPNTGNTDYGWATVTTSVPNGFPAVIDSYLYDDSGAPVFAGVVPEPSSWASLLTGVAALGWLARRRVSR